MADKPGVMSQTYRSRLSRLLRLSAFSAIALLTGCEQLGIETPETIASAREADGRAIGGACRHAGRAIEDCYLFYKKAERSAVFAGWRDMNDYMRENEIESVKPILSVKPEPETPAVDADLDASESARNKKVAAAKH